MANAVNGLYVNVRVEGATDADVMKAANLMGLWTGPNVKMYDKNDGTGVFIYARKYLNPRPSATVPPARPAPALARVAPRVVQRGGPVRQGSRPAPTSTDYDDSEDREYRDQTGGNDGPPF